MRIALITADFHPHIGGQESRFLAIATELTARGHDVDVLCIGHHPSLAAREVLNGIRIERFPLTRLYRDRPPPPGLRTASRIARVLLVHTRYMLGIWLRLRSRHYDFVYLNQYPLVHTLAVPRKMRRTAGIDWCELRTDFPHPFAQRLLPRKFRINLCVQADLAAQLAQQSNVDVGYLPSGAFIARYRSAPPHSREGWLFLGRWFPNKRLPLLIDSWVAYRKGGGSEPLIVAGDGPDRDRVKERLAGVPNDLRSEVRLPGHVDEVSKIDLLAGSRILVLTSNREGFPNVLVEAMASGLPTLTVDEPLNGAASVVRSLGVGEVVPPEPKRISEAARNIEANWAQYSEASTTAARDFDWSGIVDRLIDAFVGNQLDITER